MVFDASLIFFQPYAGAAIRAPQAARKVERKFV
jgi:hypothetical protein